MLWQHRRKRPYTTIWSVLNGLLSFTQKHRYTQAPQTLRCVRAHTVPSSSHKRLGKLSATIQTKTTLQFIALRTPASSFLFARFCRDLEQAWFKGNFNTAWIHTVTASLALPDYCFFHQEGTFCYILGCSLLCLSSQIAAVALLMLHVALWTQRKA